MKYSKWSEENRRYWDQIAGQYNSLYSSPWSQQENEAVAENLHRLRCMAAATRVLDLGCGTGLGLEMCKAMSGDIEYVGLDVSKKALNILREVYGNQFVVIGDMAKSLPFSSESFDLVISLFSSVSFSFSWQKTVEEVFRVLRPGGQAYLSTLNRWSFRRILRGKLRSRELYRTRGSAARVHGARAPAWAISSVNFEKHLLGTGFIQVRQSGIGMFGGVLEWSPIWEIDVCVTRRFPRCAHISDWSVVKPMPQKPRIVEDVSGNFGQERD